MEKSHGLFDKENQGKANFQVSLQKYVIPCPTPLQDNTMPISNSPAVGCTATFPCPSINPLPLFSFS